MGIPDEDVARVRAETDIVALIGEHAALKKVGRRWQGLCPFHGEKTPSFSVNAEEGFYYCFGCQAKGDAITFVRAIEHLDFVDAVRRLADKAGITIREDATSGRDSQRRKVFHDAMEQATEWYHQRLLTSADAGQARDYLRSRGYDGEVVRRFRLGWAPDDWDALCQGLGLSQEIAVGAGLGFVNRRNRLQDAFRARVLFPIFDPSGRPVALGDGCCPGAPIRPSTRIRPSRRSMPSARRSTPSTGPSRTSSRPTRWWCVRGTPMSSDCSGRAWSAPWPPAARRWPRSTSSCSGGSPPAWCWPSTPMAPDRRPPGASTSGSANCRSTWRWPPCRPDRTPARSPATIPTRCGRPSRGPSRSSSSGWSGSSPPPSWALPRAAPAPPTRRWWRWPSTPTTWCGTSTSCRWPSGAVSNPICCGTGWSTSARRDPARPDAHPGPAISSCGPE